jgi:DNA-binding IclR family transcriptional regulator
VRAAGYAHEDGSVTPGFASVAVAVLDHAGHPAASVALTFPAAEVDGKGRAELASRVARAAAQVASRIRGRPLG